MSVAHAEPLTIELDAARQFDFWLGEWDCSWHADGLEHVGTNSVYADLGAMVLVENFDGRPSLDYQGLSYSVYDRKAQCWRQTWVDSEGTYLDFAGRYEDGAMELRRSADGSLFRMRWENIEPNRFDWSYQRSDDQGETWTALWEIGYTRVL
ncbi:MAG: hypothetical protein ACRDNB_13240 [Gaiellaceae bacterium]